MILSTSCITCLVFLLILRVVPAQTGQSQEPNKSSSDGKDPIEEHLKTISRYKSIHYKITNWEYSKEGDETSKRVNNSYEVFRTEGLVAYISTNHLITKNGELVYSQNGETSSRLAGSLGSKNFNNWDIRKSQPVKVDCRNQLSSFQLGDATVEKFTVPNPLTDVLTLAPFARFNQLKMLKVVPSDKPDQACVQVVNPKAAYLDGTKIYLDPQNWTFAKSGQSEFLDDLITGPGEFGCLPYSPCECAT